MMIPISIGIILSLLGFIYSVITTKRSLKKEGWNEFIKTYWLHVAVKFGVLFICIIILIFMLNIDKKEFLLSFFISYLFFLLIEVFYLNKTKNFSNFATKKNNKVK